MNNSYIYFVPMGGFADILARIRRIYSRNRYERIILFDTSRTCYSSIILQYITEVEVILITNYQ